MRIRRNKNSTQMSFRKKCVCLCFLFQFNWESFQIHSLLMAVLVIFAGGEKSALEISSVFFIHAEIETRSPSLDGPVSLRRVILE
jgi:hypothetical protein